MGTFRGHLAKFTDAERHIAERRRLAVAWHARRWASAPTDPEIKPETRADRRPIGHRWTNGSPHPTGR